MRGYLEGSYKLRYVATEVGLTQQSVSTHFAQFLGKPVSEIPRPKTPSDLPLQTLITRCTCAAENGNQYALSLTRMCRDIFSDSDAFTGKLSRDYRRIYGIVNNKNKTVRLYAINPSARSSSRHLYIRSDITRPMKEADFVVFAAANDKMDGWFLFQSHDLPDITTISLRIGSQVSKYRFMYRRHFPWNDVDKEARDSGR